MIIDNMTPNNIYPVIDNSLRQDAEVVLKCEVTGKMNDYGVRQSQKIRMMETCPESAEDGDILLADAGTGTGKTFVYLIPVMISPSQNPFASATGCCMANPKSDNLGER